MPITRWKNRMNWSMKVDSLAKFKIQAGHIQPSAAFAIFDQSLELM